MKKVVAAASPDAYVKALRGWRRALVEELREAARSVKGLDEVVKWGHLVYLVDGPVLLIRAEETRVLFGFWQGQRLTAIEPRLKAGGKYEMATLALRDGVPLSAATARRLVRAAVAFNTAHGDPTLAARPPRARRAPRSAR